MVEFLVKHKLINTSQHGFLKARSCLTNLLCFFFEEITKSPVDVVYLDFQICFEWGTTGISIRPYTVNIYK